MSKQKRTSWNKGLTKNGDSRINSGKNHGMWKDNKVSYSGLHKRVIRYFGKPQKCSNCGENSKNGKRNNIEWANIDGNYNFDRKNWTPLCIRCHRIMDGNIKNLEKGKKFRFEKNNTPWNKGAKYRMKNILSNPLD